jgi:hypothetical protein
MTLTGTKELTLREGPLIAEKPWEGRKILTAQKDIDMAMASSYARP